MLSKAIKIHSKKILDCAHNEECTIQIAGVCNYDPATTVFMHFPDESHGMSKKSDDLSGGFGCSACHDAVDGRVKSEEFKEYSDFYMRRSQNRTLRRLVDKNIISVR